MIEVKINSKKLALKNETLLKDAFKQIKGIAKFNNSKLTNSDYLFYMENKTLSLDYILAVYNSVNYEEGKEQLLKIEVANNVITFKQL